MHPSKRKLTCREYNARAMMLPNAGYGPLQHIIHVYDKANMRSILVDPDTMEEMSQEERKRRTGELYNTATRREIDEWVTRTS